MNSPSLNYFKLSFLGKVCPWSGMVSPISLLSGVALTTACNSNWSPQHCQSILSSPMGFEQREATVLQLKLTHRLLQEPIHAYTRFPDRSLQGEVKRWVNLLWDLKELGNQVFVQQWPGEEPKYFLGLYTWSSPASWQLCTPQRLSWWTGPSFWICQPTRLASFRYKWVFGRYLCGLPFS